MTTKEQTGLESPRYNDALRMTGPHTTGQDWTLVDDVLLDMDGTLLDRDFDNFFFEEELPRRYAIKHGLPELESRARLSAMYRAVEGKLEWTDLHYWTRTLGIDLVSMTKELDHRIAFHPDAVGFLQELRARRKRLHLVTNAHYSGLQIKVARTGIDRYVDRIVNAFDIGYLKMRPEFWPHCQKLLGFRPDRTLYVDDDEACVAAASQYGIGHVYHRSKSSSRLPPQPSMRYCSIENFHALLTPPPA
jgi:HAD superfamily hydrolase (TIGR01509 family)